MLGSGSACRSIYEDSNNGYHKATFVEWNMSDIDQLESESGLDHYTNWNIKNKLL